MNSSSGFWSAFGQHRRELFTSVSFVTLRPKRRASLSNSLRRAQAADLLLGVNEVLDLVAGPRGGDEVPASRGSACARRRRDFHDVAVPQPGAERNHLAVHPRADALMADVGVDRVGEIHGRRVAWKRLHFPFGVKI